MSVFDDFAAGYPFGLDAFQRDACAQVEQGAGVLVAAPTGAGKTVVGEFAARLALETGRKCFYTTPIKALSNQKYHDLAARHGERNVGLLTGDTSVNGEAPVVVMTTEVLRNMIYAGSATLEGLGFVVLDEVHYLADRFRGAAWEEVIICLPPSVQVVALSATVSNAEEFGAWLAEVRGDMGVVVSESRPVPLYQHVLAGKRLYDLFVDTPAGPDVNPELVRLAKEEARMLRDDARRPRGRSGNGRRGRGYASFGGGAARERNEAAQRLVPRRDATVEQLDAAGLLPAIYFIFSRAGCDAAVTQLMRSRPRLTSAPERSQLDEIAARHVRALTDADLTALGYGEWLDAFRGGVAAHHAGLLPAFKEAIEEGFTRGLVKVVFATETLALGINMPARSVVLEKLVKYNGDSHADITAGEYTQLTGRAGRRGIDVEGHAVVSWQPGLDPRAVAGLASRRTYPLRSSFSPTYNMAVNLVATVGRDAARELLEQSFAQYQSDASVVGLARSIARSTAEAKAAWAAAACDRGDFEEYARLRAEISVLERAGARRRRDDRRAEASEVLGRLAPGDVVELPAKRHRSWAVVLDVSVAAGGGPRPLVLTADRQVSRLTLADFPVPPLVAGRVRVPRHFDPRQPAMRRTLAAVLRAKLDAGVPDPDRYRDATADDLIAEIAGLRARLEAHPCHACPQREDHARLAEQALRLERDAQAQQERVSRRTNTIAERFDRICSVLESLAYLDDGGRSVTAAGRMLQRIYSECDLVTAEAIRAGVFDGLTAPQLAAVASSLVFDARDDRLRPRMPDRASEQAQSALRAIWHQVSLVERDHRLPASPAPDIGFAQAIYLWTSGRPLGDVLDASGLAAGDFVRDARQVVDFLGQLAQASDEVRAVAREAMASIRRGVVE